MRVINKYLEKYVKYLYLLTILLGVMYILTVSQSGLSFLSVYFFLVGVLNLWASWGLYKKLHWGWKITVLASILSLIYLFLYWVLNGFVVNLLVLYLAIKFRKHLVGKESAKISTPA